MRKRILRFLAGFLAVLTALFCVCFCVGCGEESNDILRLHIRANSNLEADQAVKLKVRDEVSAFLEERLGGETSLNSALKKLAKLEGEIKTIADKVLAKNGFNYTATVHINNEFFPTRMYENIVVESGYYDALIINLGSGTGDNWWCVIYPPLCYLEVNSTGDFKYKSKLKELWDKYFG